MTESPVARAMAEANIWVVELVVDPLWYAEQESRDPIPPVDEPTLIPLHTQAALIGRRSPSQNPTPEIDCGDDGGVSRRQAQLSSTDLQAGRKQWWVEDLGSVNGTYVRSYDAETAGEPFPDIPISIGTQHPIGPYDRVYLGAWTRLTLLPPMDGRIDDAR